MNLTSDFRDALPQFPVPDVVGAWWSYQNAIAKSLQELGGENVRENRECAWKQVRETTLKQIVKVSCVTADLCLHLMDSIIREKLFG